MHWYKRPQVSYLQPFGCGIGIAYIDFTVASLIHGFSRCQVCWWLVRCCPNLSEMFRNFCDVIVPLLTQFTKLAKLKAYSTFRILQALLLRTFVHSSLYDGLYSGVALPICKYERDGTCCANSCSDLNLYLVQWLWPPCLIHCLSASITFFWNGTGRNLTQSIVILSKGLCMFHCTLAASLLEVHNVHVCLGNNFLRCQELNYNMSIRGKLTFLTHSARAGQKTVCVRSDCGWFLH